MKFLPKDQLKFIHAANPRGDSCWEWTAGKDQQGYGMFYANHKTYKAHRVSYFLHYGEFDLSLCVCHKCDNPSCVNPSHLFLGTVTDNNSDRHNKGRSKNKPTPGMSHNMAKLTDRAVLDIRSRVDVLQKELAQKYGVSVATISRIQAGKTWKHLTTTT